MDVIQCANCPTRQLSAFKHLPPEEVEILCKNKRFNTMEKGEEILREDHHPKGVFCVQNGHFKLITHAANGKETIVRFASPGELIGYRALLAGEPLSVSAVALQEASACFVPGEVLLGFLQHNGPFSMEILRETCHELSETNRILSSMAQKNVRERFAEILLMLRAKFGEDAEGCVNIDLKRSELADLVGTATESLIRLTSQFEKEGLLARHGKRFKVLDASKLTRIAEIYD
jgi:CRP-like cAMP-binding protein